MPGELPENTWMSEEIVSGVQPPGIATSATVKSKLPPPWPTSKSTPRCLAASAAGMDHHLRRPAAHLAGLDTALQRLKTVLVDDILRHPHLHPDKEIGVFSEPHRAGFNLRIVDVVELG